MCCRSATYETVEFRVALLPLRWEYLYSELAQAFFKDVECCFVVSFTCAYTALKDIRRNLVHGIVCISKDGVEEPHSRLKLALSKVCLRCPREYV